MNIDKMNGYVDKINNLKVEISVTQEIREKMFMMGKSTRSIDIDIITLEQRINIELLKLEKYCEFGF